MPGCLTRVDFERYAAGKLDDASSADLDRHLQSCESCRTAYERFRSQQATDNKAHLLASDRTVTVAPSGAGTAPPTAKLAKHFPKIDGYALRGVVGQGGMGIVYRAVQTKLNRTVALKVLPAIVGSASPSIVLRFQREATAAARLHHTNIIPIYDFGESHDAYYYAMELVVGKSFDVVIRRLGEADAPTASAARLAHLLQSIVRDEDSAGEQHEAPGSDHSALSGRSAIGRGRLYYQQVARWFADAADALHYAHHEGIIHRDIKPGNLILSVDGRVMIADFGLAKSADEQSMTQTGSLMGTLRYMSPEQTMARRLRVDHRTDIYSLGATMYELLTFCPAFGGDDDKAILGAIITKDPTPPHKTVPMVPRELETICLKSMEKSPDARYDNARAMAEDLRRYLNDLPIVAKPPGLVQRTIKLARRHKAPTVAIVMTVVLAVTVGGFFKVMRTNTVARLIKDGRQFALDRNWARAQDALEHALRIDKNNPEAVYSLAYMKWRRLNAMGERPGTEALKEVKEDCLRALQYNRDYVQALNLLGVTYKKLGEYDHAIDAYQRAIELEPGQAYVWTNLGVIYALKKDLDAAQRKLKKATDLGGTDKPYNVDAWRGLAALQLHLGDRTTAAETIAAAHRCNKKDLATYAIEARLLLDSDPRRALQAAIQANFGGGGDAKALRLRALANLRTGQFDAAAEDAASTLQRGDMATINHLILAIAYGKLGRTEDARAHLQKATDAWPAALRNDGDFIATADKGVLWFETFTELKLLRDEAEELLVPTSH